MVRKHYVLKEVWYGTAFVSFRVAVPANMLLIFNSFVLTNQILNLLRSNYKFSLLIYAAAPSKKLTFIQIDVQTEVRESAVSRICEQIKEVVGVRNPFHLT